MSGFGTPITTNAQFARIQVYLRQARHGPVYTIVFRNLERKNDLEKLLMILLVFGIIAGLLQLYPVAAVLFIVLGLPAAGLRAELNGPPRRLVRRAIELDPGRDEMRFYRGAAFEGAYALSRLVHLTVEDHPDVEREKINRQERGKKGPGHLQYIHCLFGWFGIGGADKTELMHRVEWPSRHSLREVREAIEWTRRRIAAGGSQAGEQSEGTRQQSRRTRHGRGAPLH